MAVKTPPFVRLYQDYSENESGCWIWLGQTGSSGYGQIKAFGKTASCHRLSYQLYFGDIPEGSEILHQCDNRLCINPDHLSIGSHAENMADAASRNRMKKGEDHHAYGKKNPRPRQSNKVLVLGKSFDSQKQAERAFGLGSGTVRYWLKNKPQKGKIIEKGELCNA